MDVILQHWVGDDIPEYVKLSQHTVKAYAERIGAEYRFLNETYYPEFGAPVQKLVAFEHDRWSDYNQVLVIDTDVVVKPDAPNIFEEDGAFMDERCLNPRKKDRLISACIMKTNPELRKDFTRFFNSQRGHFEDRSDEGMLCEYLTNYATLPDVRFPYNYGVCPWKKQFKKIKDEDVYIYHFIGAGYKKKLPKYYNKYYK